ncbi:MAG: serine hydrolase [Anaerolineae bacterium]|nr:serine hydrolase [Anaerolineae bacterium]
MREKRSGAGWFLFIVATIVILGGAWLYLGWQSSQRVFPAGLTVAGLPMGGMTQDQAINALVDAYASPLIVHYHDQEILLVPEMVDLTLDIDDTRANLETVLLAQSGPQGFFNYIRDTFLQREIPPQDIRPILDYSRARIDAFLKRTAQEYDHPPLEPVPLPDAGAFRPPQPGTELDAEASLPDLITALLSPTIQEVALVVEITPVGDASMDVLEQALRGRLEDFNGIPGIFVKNLDTGQELCFNCGVAFSGLSTLKIGIVLDLYKALDTAPDTEVSGLIRAALTESDNAAANLILQEIGAGDPFTGALRVTDFLSNDLGLTSTFLAVPYDLKEGIEPPGWTTPANSRAAFFTNPDPYIQTTPMEIGLLLESLVWCSQDAGFLRLIFPQALSAGECQTILAYMEQNRIKTLLAEGMPEGTRIAHKHGWTGETHGDVAVVYSPGGTFVLSVFLYEPDWLIWEESAPTFADLGRLTYRFFNPEAAP